MLDHFQNIKRHTDTSTSTNNICLVIVLFPSNCFGTSSFHSIKEEGTIYYMHDSELKTGLILFFSTVHRGPGTIITNALSAFSLYWKTHAFGRLFTARFCRKNTEDKENCFNLFNWFNFFPAISWLPLLNCNCKTVIMRAFYTFAAYIFIGLGNY